MKRYFAFAALVSLVFVPLGCGTLGDLANTGLYFNSVRDLPFAQCIDDYEFDDGELEIEFDDDCVEFNRYGGYYDYGFDYSPGFYEEYYYEEYYFDGYGGPWYFDSCYYCKIRGRPIGVLKKLKR